MNKQTCPSCSRSWVPTPFDDCFAPDCGCYGTLEEMLDSGTALCEACGFSHAFTCEKMPNPVPRKEPGDVVKVVEIGGPAGEVVYRPSLEIREVP